MQDPIGLEYLNDLNSAQREAVVYNDGPALVIAGAGSGKTRVLVYKLLHLIRCGYPPYKLMALTFTNKAAREMRQRISLYAPEQARFIRMGTFHSIFMQILRIHAELLGYTSSFSIYNTTDSKNRIKAIIKLMGLDDKVYKPAVVLHRISSAKNRLISPETYRATVDLLRADAKAQMPSLSELYTRYSAELKQNNAMDFDDLLFQINVLFRDYPDVLAHWQERIDYLLIDEYQDTNFAQYMIAKQLMQHKGAIFVVGDDAQSIYSFRGANLENMLGFKKTFPTAKTFKLEQNYRSSQTIVQAAGALIAHNQNQIPKDVFSLGDIGEQIELHETYSADLEAMWVCKTIEQLRDRYGANYEDCAVLYRTNAQSRILEQVFRRMNIPFRIYGGRSFFDHKEIMDVIAYLRLMINPYDNESLLRIINYPRRGIGDTTVQKMQQAANLQGVSVADVLAAPAAMGLTFNKGTLAKLQSFHQLLEDMRALMKTELQFFDLAQQLITRTGIPLDLMSDNSGEGKMRQQNVKELLASIKEYELNNLEAGTEPSLESYLSEISLMTDQDTGAEDEVGVTAMTMHASKGLEFPHVFIVGLDEPLFPSYKHGEPDDLEEERRLFYVALTRAEKTCHIGYVRERFINGQTTFVRPSRFLRELPPNLLRHNAAARSTLALQQEREHDFWGHRSNKQEGASLPKTFTTDRSFLPTNGGRMKHLGRRSTDDPLPKKHRELGDFKVGMRVLHKRFGQGEILDIEQGAEATATICFDDGNTRKLLLRFLNISVVE
ncbi:MAG: 3'-5' exonuclease [Porphyromonadaceae bacterium]|nr:3'-5' exonuclease [Porphyromonadaceae bacterium]